MSFELQVARGIRSTVCRNPPSPFRPLFFPSPWGPNFGEEMRRFFPSRFLVPQKNKSLAALAWVQTGGILGFIASFFRAADDRIRLTKLSLLQGETEGTEFVGKVSSPLPPVPQSPFPNPKSQIRLPPSAGLMNMANLANLATYLVVGGRRSGVSEERAVACHPQSKSLTSDLRPLSTDQSHDIESSGKIQQLFLAVYERSLAEAQSCVEDKEELQ